MVYGSTYERFFGRYHEMSAGEAELLKYRKLSQLKTALPLNNVAMAYLDSWVALKEDDTYINMLLFTLRQLYTYLKGLQPSTSRNTEHFAWIQKFEVIP